MNELSSLIKHLEDKPLIYPATSLSDKDRTLFYIIHNRIVNAITVENPKYKNMSDLLQEASNVISEMSNDIYRLAERGYGRITIIDNLTFKDAIKELELVNLSNYQNCINYLTDLSLTSLAVIQCNDNLTQIETEVFYSIIYICLIALNKFSSVQGEELVLEGVGIVFGARTR